MDDLIKQLRDLADRYVKNDTVRPCGYEIDELLDAYEAGADEAGISWDARPLDYSEELELTLDVNGQQGSCFVSLDTVLRMVGLWVKR